MLSMKLSNETHSTSVTPKGIEGVKKTLKMKKTTHPQMCSLSRQKGGTHFLY